MLLTKATYEPREPIETVPYKPEKSESTDDEADQVKDTLQPRVSNIIFKVSGDRSHGDDVDDDDDD